MLYFLYCSFLLCFVYLLPALSFFPRLCTKPSLMVSVPIISAGIIYLLTSLLVTFNLFQTPVVTACVLAMGFVAAFRIRDVLKRETLHWPRFTTLLLGFNLLIMIPFFVKLGTHSFDSHDEIYSWNFWAIQYFFHESIDFSHTSATYPQLFPKVLSFCYMLLGNIELQLPVKGLLFVFPLSTLNAWVIAHQRHNIKQMLVYSLLLIFVVFFVNLKQFFNDGYADPVMTGALALSCAYFFKMLNVSKDQKTYLLLALACALIATASKQPALIWSLFAFPVLLLIHQKRCPKPLVYGVVIASVMGALTWLLTEGSDFQNNQGVIWLSKYHRGYGEQLLFAANKYFIQTPMFLILTLLSIWVGFKNRIYLSFMICFIMPSILMWFIFGSYQLRLGQHIIAAMTVMLISSGYLVTLAPAGIMKKLRMQLIEHARPVKAGLTFLSLAIAGGMFYHNLYVQRQALDPLIGGQHTLHRYFTEDAAKVYSTIYQEPDTILWVPTRYLYGIFYKHTQLVTPNYQSRPYTYRTLVRQLKDNNVDYAFTVSPAIIDGPGSGMLKDLVSSCPDIFELYTDSSNPYDYKTYKIHKEELNNLGCLVALENSDISN